MKPVPLGAIIAGGSSSRFGAPKALARIGEERIIDRVCNALAQVTPDIVTIANDPAIADSLPYDSRPDSIAGIGALAGVLTALEWAQDRGIDWALAVACDMPFLDARLLTLLVDAIGDGPQADLIAPASRGPRAIEPLCAAYRITCIDPIRTAVARGDARMIGFHADIDLRIIPMAEVEAIRDPDVLFMNVNTRDDLQRAARMIEGVGA